MRARIWLSVPVSIFEVVSDQPAGPDRGEAPRPADVPSQVLLAAVIIALEGAIIVVLGVLWAIRSVTDSPDNVGASIMGAIFAVVAGVVLVRLALGISKGQPWARSPVVAVQILFLPVSFSLAFQGGDPAYGVPALVACALVIYLLFTPPAKLVFNREVPLN